MTGKAGEIVSLGSLFPGLRRWPAADRSRKGWEMSNEVEQFNDGMADAYHLIFEEWDKAIARQAGVLDTLIKTTSFMS